MVPLIAVVKVSNILSTLRVVVHSTRSCSVPHTAFIRVKALYMRGRVRLRLVLSRTKAFRPSRTKRWRCLGEGWTLPVGDSDDTTKRVDGLVCALAQGQMERVGASASGCFRFGPSRCGASLALGDAGTRGPEMPFTTGVTSKGVLPGCVDFPVDELRTVIVLGEVRPIVGQNVVWPTDVVAVRRFTKHFSSHHLLSPSLSYLSSQVSDPSVFL